MNELTKQPLVLIIEDDPSLQKILQAKLAGEGVQVMVAATGAEAFPLIKSDVPNLIVLDIMLPGGMNGFDILERLKQEGTVPKTPVIVLTNLEAEEKTALDIGAVAYIGKTTLSIDEIVKKVKSFLR